VAVDGSGNVFVTGSSTGSGSFFDYATVAYSGAGVPLWTNRYNGPANGDDLVTTKYCLAIAPDGVVVAGYSDVAPLPGVTVNDFAVVKYLINLTISLPDITSQPQSVTLGCGDGPAVFSVTASGGPSLSYQWYLNGALLAGATASNHVVNLATPTTAGGYTVVITNAQGAVTSSVAVLTLTNQTLSVLAADAFSLNPGGTLVIPPSAFASNDVAGTCSGTPTELTFLTFSPTSANGGSLAWLPGGIPLWTNRYNGPGNGPDQVSAVAVDGSGNVFVTGSSTGSGGNSDYATVAYSGTGVALWTNRYNGPGNGDDVANAVAVDGSGNVFVTGYSTGSGSSLDYATVAYSGAGVPLWTNRYNGPGNGSDQAYAVAVDGSGNVFVIGSSGRGSSLDYATVAYSRVGVPLWTNRYHGPSNGNDYARAVAVDGSGNVFVIGDSPGSGSDYATVAYSGAGVPLWTNRYNGPANANDYARAVAVDGSGNVFVTGYSAGSGSGWDYATVAYSGAGVPLWTNRYNDPGNGADQTYAVAVDGGGNVFVTGSSTGSGGNSDYATVAYSGSGVPLWTNRYNGPANANDYARAVAVGGGGNVFVTGSSTGSGGNSDYATVGYSGTGLPLWTNRYNGPGNSDDQARAVAVDGSGNVFVTGDSTGSGSGWDYATICYSSGQVSYTPTNGFIGVDTFTYVMQDGYGLTYTGTVAVAVGVVANVITATPTPGGEVQLGYYGLPGQRYVLERTLNLTPPAWSPQQTNAAAANGALTFTYLPVGNSTFWRIRSAP